MLRAGLDAIVEAALTSLGSGIGGAIAVVGGPGAGVSSMLDAIVARAAHRGHRVVRATGDPHGGASHGLVDAIAHDRSTSGLRDHVVAPVAPVAPVDLAIGWLDTAAGTVVVVDDVDLGDGSVGDGRVGDGGDERALALVVGALVRRARTAGVLVVVGSHDELGPAVAEIDRAAGSVIRLLPIPRDELTALVESRLGAVPDDALLDALDLAGGVPGIVVELLDDLLATGAVAVSGRRAVLAAGVVEVSPRISGRFARRAMRTLGAGVAEAAAVLGDGWTVDDLAQVASVPVDAAVDAIRAGLAAELLIDTPSGLGFRSTLVRDAVREVTAGSIARALHRRAADAVARRGDPAELRHLLAAVDPSDPDDVLGLASAVERHASTAPVTALGAARLVLRSGAPTELRSRITGVAVDAAIASGDLGAARELAEDLAAATDAPSAWEAMAFTEVLAGRLAGIVDDIARGGAHRGVLTTRHRGQLALVALLGGDLTAAQEHLEAAEPNDEFAVVASAWSAGVAGRSADGLARLDAADRTGWDGTALADLAEAVLADGAGFAERASAAIARAAVDADRGRGWARPLVHSAGAVIALRAGRLDDALAEVAASRTLAADTGVGLGLVWSEAVAAMVHLVRGEIDRASAEIGAAQESLAVEPTQLGVDWLVWAQARLAAARGEEWVSTLGAVAELCLDAGLAHVVTTFGPELVLVDPLGPVAARLAEVALDRGDGGGPAGRAAAAAMLAARAQHAADLDAAADGWLVSDRPVDAAVTRLAAARRWLADGERRAARRSALEALAVLERIGAWGSIEVLRREFTTMRLPRHREIRPASGWGALTATEHRVVAALAAGRTNGEIATELGMSRRTVESHLSRVYDKTGIETRAALIAAAVRRTHDDDGR